MTRPKILIVGGGGPGGMNTFVEEQEQNLSKEFDVDVFNTYVGYDGCIGFLTSIFISLYRLFKFPFRTLPDLVHVNSSAYLDFYRASFYIFTVAYIWNKPVVVRFGGSGFDEFIETDSRVKQRYFSLVLSSIDQILVLTELQKSAVKQYVSDENVHILRQTTEVENFSPNFEYEIPRLLYLASLNERKGTPEFIQTIDTLCQRDDLEFRVDIAGDGSYREEIEALADKYGQVEYHGYVTGQEKFELYNNASIFVLPTHSEGFPNVIIEAMAGGNAIITTTASGIPEIVGEENGITIEPGNIGELTSAIAELTSNPDRVENMGITNHATATEDHDWSATVSNLEAIYQKILKKY